MASKMTYECFICKRNGHPETRVYLDGKDEYGRTVYKNEDMSAHQHKQKQTQQLQQQSQQPEQQQTTDLILQVKLVHQKLDLILDRLGSSQQVK